MPRDPAELLKDVLSLPAKARAALIDSLLESLDTEIDDDAEASWRQESHSRLQQIDSGAVKLRRWEDARPQLLTRLEL